MVTLEQVEKLKERVNVSYEDAKSALEYTDGDLLEAVIYLEKQGKIPSPEMSSFNTYTGKMHRDGYYADERQQSGPRYHQPQQGPTIRQQLGYFWRKLCELVRKTNANQFEISRIGNPMISMPVTLLIISSIFFFWVTIPLLIIGLFLGFRYRFNGPDFGKEAINNAMNQAAETAESIKRSIMTEENRANEE